MAYTVGKPQVVMKTIGIWWVPRQAVTVLVTEAQIDTSFKTRETDGALRFAKSHHLGAALP